MTSKAQQRKAKRTAAQQRRRLIEEAAKRHLILNRDITLDDVKGRHLPGPWNYGLQADQDVEARSCPQCFRPYSDYEETAVSPCWQCRERYHAIPLDRRGGLPAEFTASQSYEESNSWTETYDDTTHIKALNHAAAVATYRLKAHMEHRTSHDGNQTRILKSELAFSVSQLSSAARRAEELAESRFFQFLRTVDPEECIIENHQILLSIGDDRAKSKAARLKRAERARKAKAASLKKAREARRAKEDARVAKEEEVHRDKWQHKIDLLYPKGDAPESPSHLVIEKSPSWRKEARVHVLALCRDQEVITEAAHYALQVIHDTTIRVTEVYSTGGEGLTLLLRKMRFKSGKELQMFVCCNYSYCEVYVCSEKHPQGVATRSAYRYDRVQEMLTSVFSTRKQLVKSLLHRHSGTRKLG